MNRSLILREFTDADLPLFAYWLSLPHVALWYDNPQNWIEEINGRTSVYQWIHHYIAETDRRPIGFGQYYEYAKGGEDWHGSTELRGTYSMDYLIGEPDCLKKGLGRLLVQVLAEKIRLTGKAKRIIVQPEADNQASCNTLLSCGFHFDTANQLYRMELGPEKPQ